jgi:hypothetical protein
MGCEIIDLDVIRRAELHTDPYPYFTGSSFIAPDAVAGIQASFPDLKKTGFHPASDMNFTGAFAKLMAELESDELVGALSEKLGADFANAARFITIRKVSAAHEGRIHCDGEAKVGNFLVYLNDEWSGHDGCLRVLRRQDSFDDYVAEIDPTTGSVFGFLRRDNSWHGHKPFVGERRVIQVAWLRSQEELERKTSRHRFQDVLKGIFGR